MGENRVGDTAKKKSFSYEMKEMDCIKGMRLLESESVDIVVTSPPYNLGIDYNKYKDTLSRGEYIKWSKAWAVELERVLSKEGSFFLNIAGSPKDPLLPHQIAIEFSNIFTLQNTFHWIKNISIPKDDSYESKGHFKPINSKRFVTDCHEYIFHFTKTGNVPLDRLSIGVPYEHKSNINRWGHTEGKDKRCRGNNWFIPYKTINSRIQDRPHPATYPVELAENCIKMHGFREELVVMDPFLGIGHTAQAALNCGVQNFYGFDIDSVYLAEAKKRIDILPLHSESVPIETSLEVFDPEGELQDIDSLEVEVIERKEVTHIDTCDEIQEVDSQQELLF